MNKLEKHIIEATCKEASSSINTKNIGFGNIELKLSSNKEFNKIGASYEQITEALKSFAKQEFFDKVENTPNGWLVVTSYQRLIKLLNKALEGNKLTAGQGRSKQILSNRVREIEINDKRSEFNKTLEEQFNNGKWLRLCCASCGDFIQEITVYNELIELEDKVIECRRNHHKNRFKLENEVIIFTSEDTKILELLKDKKFDK